MSDDRNLLGITKRRHCDHDACTVEYYDVGFSESVFDDCELTYFNREDAEKAVIELLTLAKQQLERNP